MSASTWHHRHFSDLRLVLLLASFTTLYYLHRRVSLDHSETLGADLLHTFSWDLLFWSVLVLGVALLHPRLPTAGPRRWGSLLALGLATGGLGLLAFCQASAWRMNGWQVPAVYLPQMAVYCLTWGLLLTGLYEFSWQRRRADESLHGATVQQAALRGELDAARTQLLQAQIEPHFLFNTLANVRELLADDPARACSLLDDLGRYLQAALPRLREGAASLGQEVELVQALLAIHQVRMGARRLQWRVDVADDKLLDAELPPMLLLTLVENALKHGLAPLPEGGCITLRAEQAGDGRLKLAVADNGAGMGSGSGSGMGLANTRARLRAAYGEAGRLELRLNQPRGVVAELLLPLRPATPAAPAAIS